MSTFYLSFNNLISINNNCPQTIIWIDLGVSGLSKESFISLNRKLLTSQEYY